MDLPYFASGECDLPALAPSLTTTLLSPDRRNCIPQPIRGGPTLSILSDVAQPQRSLILRLYVDLL